MKRILLLVFLCSVSLWADAQALLGTTGLLHASQADMQRDKTFLFGGNYLNTHPLSTHFRSSEVGYTFNYYINITIFPWLEVAYICTLVHADHGSTYFPEQSWGKFTNQDRAFSARLRLWKEGWWKEWTPQIVVGQTIRPPTMCWATPIRTIMVLRVRLRWVTDTGTAIT